MSSLVVDVAGCPIHIDIVGNGPPVLFIQGVGVAGCGWRPQVDAFADRFTCATFDNRGLGRSVPVGVAPLTVDRMAADAIAVMDALGWRTAQLVGHSLGGVIALAVALAAPTRVRSLALFCTMADGRRVGPPTPRMIWWGVRTRIGTRRMRRHAFLHLLYPPGGVVDPESQAAALATIFGRDLGDGPPIVDAQLRALRAVDLTPRLGDLVEIPTLVVNARHDLIAAPSLGLAIAAGMPGSRFVEIEDAAHGLPVTHVARTNALLAEHFRLAHSCTQGRAGDAIAP